MSDSSPYYDLDGNRISMAQWCILYERSFQTGEKFLQQEEVELPGGGRAFVSTVWLGLDHSCAIGPHAPLIFETMIFWESGDYGSEDYCVRTPTREAALAEHDQACQWARSLGQRLPEGLRIKEDRD